MRRFAWLGCVVAASLAGAAAVRAETVEPPERLAPLLPATVEYRWTFRVPEWQIDTRVVTTRVYAPAWRSRTFEFDSPDWRTERRRIGSVPEFHCKYPDLALSNTCTTTWRAVYVDVPVPVLRHDSFNADVPQWAWRDERVTIDAPRLVWTERTLIVTLPALAREPPANQPD